MAKLLSYLKRGVLFYELFVISFSFQFTCNDSSASSREQDRVYKVAAV